MLNVKYIFRVFVASILLTVCLTQATTLNIGQVGLWAGGTIGFGDNVSVAGSIASGGSISAGNNMSLNSIYTESGIWTGNNSIINGDILANRQVQIGNNVVISGSVTSFGDFTLPVLGLMEQTAIGTNDIYGKKNSTTTVSADSYRDFSFDKNTTLNISAGQYNLRNFWVNRSSTVNVDTSAGDVVLNVSGSFGTSKEVSFVNSGPGNLYINVFGHDVWLDDSVKLSAVLKVYGGNIDADNSVQLSGQFFATGDIWLGNNSSLSFVSGTPASSIPEPASLVIFAVMGLCSFIVKNQRPKYTEVPAS
ncbi:MAG: hypothetical protein PHP01_05455 [Phycisphaerae bacterium]|nr:hypothetical protein [Phycisphaerae bacterium]